MSLPVLAKKISPILCQYRTLLYDNSCTIYYDLLKDTIKANIKYQDKKEDKSKYKEDSIVPNPVKKEKTTFEKSTPKR